MTKQVVSQTAVAQILLIAFVHLCAGATTEPATATTRRATHTQQIDALIERLKSSDTAVRRKAEAAFVAFGGESAERLKALQQTADPDLAFRVDVLLERVRTAPYDPTTYVTLDYDDAPANVAFNDLLRQGFVEPPVGDGAGVWARGEIPTVTIHMEHRPFLEALRELCRTAHATLARSETGNGVKLEPFYADWPNHPCYVGNGYLVSLTRVARTVDVDAANAMSPPMLTIELRYLVEPKLLVHERESNLKIRRATDDTGRELTQAGNSNADRGLFLDWTQVVTLRDPPPAGHVLTKLQGQGQFRWDFGIETWNVADISKAQTQSHTIGSRRFDLTVSDSPQGNHILAVTSNSQIEESDELDVFKLWRRMLNIDAFAGEPQLAFKDNQDKPLQWSSCNKVGRTDGRGSVELDFEFPAAGPAPHSFDWPMPIDARSTTGFFEFKQVPVP